MVLGNGKLSGGMTDYHDETSLGPFGGDDGENGGESRECGVDG